MQPGIFDSKVDRVLDGMVIAPSESANRLSATETIVSEDPVLRKLRVAIDGYRARVSEWERSIRPLAMKQSVPSSTTIGLFGLGAVLCISVNAFAINSHTPTQEIALSNLGCTVLFVIAAVSLFYDRVMRGFAREVLLKRSAENATEIAIQVQALAEIQVDLQSRVKTLSRDLNDLSIEIENQNSLAGGLKEENRIAQATQSEYDAKLAELRNAIMAESSRLHRLQHSILCLENERKELDLSIQAHTRELCEAAARRETVSSELMVLESTYQSVRAAWVVEQEERRLDLLKVQQELLDLMQERSDTVRSIDSLRADLHHLRDLRAELQAEIELNGREYERRTAASVAAIADLQTKIDDLQRDHDRSRLEFDQVQAAVRNAESQRDGLIERIAECNQSKTELQDVLSNLLGQIQENHDALATARQAVMQEENRLAQRRAFAEKEAVEADSRQKERARAIQDLDGEIERIAKERDSLQAEIDRLSGVKSAMDLSIDELTSRLEMRTSDLRRKNAQLQEQADQVERLSDAIQKLSVRESEMRQVLDNHAVATIAQSSIAAGNIGPGILTPGVGTSGIIIPGIIDTLERADGITRSLHKPHFSALSRSYPSSTGTREESIGG